MDLRGMILCRRGDDDGAIRDAAEGALGQRSERCFQGPARPDRRHGSSAGEAGRNDRLAVLEERFGAVYWYKPGQPPLPTRLMAGLSILKHTHNLSDEELCARWIENPCYQLFCGEELFVHKLPFDRSSLTRWRQRMGEEKLVALIQESLNTATRTGAAKPTDFSKVIVDTTVQPKAVAFPTDAKLMHRARERLVRLAKKHGVGLRQSYERVGKRALIAHQRYAHAKQFKRANRTLKTIRTYLGRVIRDIGRKIRDEAELESAFAHPLMLARRVREQRQHQRGRDQMSSKYGGIVAAV